MEVRVSDRGTLTVLNVPHREGRCRYLIRKEEDRFWAKVVKRQWNTNENDFI